MKLYSTAIICFLSACLLAAGCTKVPDKLISATARIEPVIKENKELFTLKLNAGIQNPNSDAALMNVKGSIVFYDSVKSNAVVMAIPFTLPSILPFETGVVEINKTYTENEIMPLVIFFGSDKEKLVTEKSLERSMADDPRVRLEISEYTKEKILDVIKGKINEKI